MASPRAAGAEASQQQEEEECEYEYVLLEIPELEETNFLRQTSRRLEIAVSSRAASHPAQQVQPSPPTPRPPSLVAGSRLDVAAHDNRRAHVHRRGCGANSWDVRVLRGMRARAGQGDGGRCGHGSGGRGDGALCVLRKQAHPLDTEHSGTVGLSDAHAELGRHRSCGNTSSTGSSCSSSSAGSRSSSSSAGGRTSNSSTVCRTSSSSSAGSRTSNSSTVCRTSSSSAGSSVCGVILIKLKAQGYESMSTTTHTS